jgi:hypothetical protein
MTHLTGRTVLDNEGLATRVSLLARQLVTIHAVRPVELLREYVALTTADTVVVPKGADAAVWAAAIDVIRKPAPPYEGRFLHRYFQPGNVLFDERPSQSARRYTVPAECQPASRAFQISSLGHCWAQSAETSS